MKTPDSQSPIGLIQEELYEDPWRLLVACSMLNQTNIKQVRPTIKKFFELFPTAECCAFADEVDIAKCIRALGLYNRRARSLKKMSAMYFMYSSFGTVHDVSSLPGVGKYTSDSYQIFVKREIPGDLVVSDKELKRYVAWARTLEEKDE